MTVIITIGVLLTIGIGVTLICILAKRVPVIGKLMDRLSDIGFIGDIFDFFNLF